MSVRLTKIYTRGGDKGSTKLVGGQRIAKSSLRLETYGTVDELNCLIGVIRTYSLPYKEKSKLVYTESTETLHKIQNKLFDIGSLLATPEGVEYPGMPSVKKDHVDYLEQKIDQYNENLESLESFTLPGGGVLNAHAHVARSVCRRLERILARFIEQETALPEVIPAYINRLSDFLFVYSRWVAKELGEDEFLWVKETEDKLHH